MKRLGLVLAGTLALAGCSESSAAEETPAPEQPNAASCESFATNTERIADMFDENNGNAKDLWQELHDDFDRDALSAEGDVKERISTLVTEWPDAGQLFVYSEAREQANELILAVSRACEADGTTITVSTYSG